MTEKCFIYMIVNNYNDKVYIGWTLKSIYRRFERHIRVAVFNKNDTKFTRAMRKYGWRNFFVCKLKTCYSKKEALKFEKKFIKKYDSYYYGYNSTFGGEGRIGEMTEEHRLNIISSHKERSMKIKKEKYKSKKHFQNIKEKLFTRLEQGKNSLIKRSKIKKKIGMVWLIVLSEGEKKVVKNLRKFCRENSLDNNKLQSNRRKQQLPFCSRI